MPTINGVKNWSLTRDSDGHRTYKLKQEVYFEDGETGGLFAALNTPGLFLPGAEWDVEDDFDPYAYCQPDAEVRAMQEQEGEKPRSYTVEQTFTTKPKRVCLENPVEDPLLQPTRISGSLKGKKEEATYDRFGKPVVTSSWEQIRGKENEWDWMTATVEIEQNVAELDLGLCTSLENRVNAFEVWGLPARTIKLSGFTWEQKYYGRCYIYYTRKFSFEIDFRGWDRDLADEGTKVLRGKWTRPAAGNVPPTFLVLNNPDPKNPGDFVRYSDPYGHPGKVQLDGNGLPAGVCIDWGETDPIKIPAGEDKYYVSIVQGFPTDGHPLTEWEAWVRVRGDDPDPEHLYGGAEPVAYDPQERYVIGNIVLFLGTPYVCVSNANWGDYPIDAGYRSPNWVELSTGLNNAGVFSPAGAYALGDIVLAPGSAESLYTGTAFTPCNQNPPAKVHVEKYHDGNFLLLGIPVIF